MLPVVCMFLAGLYVASGSLGRAMSAAFWGSLAGTAGPGFPLGIPRGPSGRVDGNVPDVVRVRRRLSLLMVLLSMEARPA